MQGGVTSLAGEASGQGEESSSEGLGSSHLLAQAEAFGSANQVASDDLYSQPGGVGEETSRC